MDRAIDLSQHAVLTISDVKLKADVMVIGMHSVVVIERKKGTEGKPKLVFGAIITRPSSKLQVTVGQSEPFMPTLLEIEEGASCAFHTDAFVMPMKSLECRRNKTTDTVLTISGECHCAVEISLNADFYRNIYQHHETPTQSTLVAVSENSTSTHTAPGENQPKGFQSTHVTVSEITTSTHTAQGEPQPKGFSKVGLYVAIALAATFGLTTLALAVYIIVKRASGDQASEKADVESPTADAVDDASKE
jgi:hypothetical protein